MKVKANRQKYDEAIDNYQHAIKFNPRYFQAIINFPVTLFRMSCRSMALLNETTSHLYYLLLIDGSISRIQCLCLKVLL